MAQFMRFEAVDRELERQRLLCETTVVLSRLRLQEEDGRLHAAADAGDRLLRAAELVKLGSPESAAL